MDIPKENKGILKNILFKKDSNKEITPETITPEGVSDMGINLKGLAILLTGAVIGFFSQPLLVHSDPAWAQYLPTGQAKLAKAVMRVCEDKELCPKGPASAVGITITGGGLPGRAPASVIPPSDSLKMEEVPSLSLEQDIVTMEKPLASLPSMGKQLLASLGSITQKTQH